MQKITAVAGLPGVGKTNWICQQFTEKPTLYLSPAVQFLADDQQAQLWNLLASGVTAYLELGYHLDLAKLSLILDTLNCYRVAIVPAGGQAADWEEWADEIVEGLSTATNATSLSVANTTGHVIAPD